MGTRGLVVALFAGLVVQSGCAHGKVTQVRKELGGVSRGEAIFVREFATEKAEFAGDNSEIPEHNQADRALLQQRIGPDLVQKLRGEGWKAEPWAEGAEGVVLEGTVTRFDRGSSAKRAWLGMGAGASTLFTTLQVRRGEELLCDLDVAATSGGRGGFAAMGEFTQAHIEDTVGTIAGYLEDRVPK